MSRAAKLIRLLPKRAWWVLVLLAVFGLAAWLVLRTRSESASASATFIARRGPLEISVLVGGSIQALESQEIKCEVRVGYQGTKILKIVEEGYQVGEADVALGKVLVELDSSELQKQLVQQEIQFQSALASLTDAQKAYEIQLNQNISDIKAAEQKGRFALMDFKKFLGDNLAVQIVKEVGLELAPAIDLASLMPAAFQPDLELTNPPALGPTNSAPVENRDVPALVALSANGSSPPSVGTTNSPALTLPVPDPLPEFNLSVSAYSNALAKSVLVDFSKYASLELLGDGEAKQKMRKFEDDLQVAKKELGQAKSTLEGTQRLYAKSFVTRTDLQRDEIAFENSRLKVQTAETAQALFLSYDFSKTAEENLSKYAETARELDRACQAAIAKLAQAAAKLRSAQAQYAVQLRQLNELKDQLSKCIIRATKTGLVIYGGSRDNMYYFGGEEQIREGATVREHQAIITIPDMTKMGVRVQIHESYIKKVKKDQTTRITVDAFPDILLEGEVTKVSVLPDSQNRWMNPEMKVYQTTIRIDEVYDWLKPGMSAKVEIFVDHLEDVVYVPFQCVVAENGKRFCYLASRFRPERREVETGQFNDQFIEITRGLAEGDTVLLRPPESTAPAADEQLPPGSNQPKPPTPLPAQAKPTQPNVTGRKVGRAARPLS
jgi:HlyD family secretion protein